MNTARLYLLATIFALMSPALAASPACAVDSVGTITQIQGTATLDRGGAPVPITNDTPVMLHDKITTGPNSLVGIYFADGSTLSITSSTSVELAESTMVNGNAVVSKVKLFGGLVHANVPDKPGVPTRRLEIDSTNTHALGPAPSLVP
jgi:hypothetical protein